MNNIRHACFHKFSIALKGLTDGKNALILDATTLQSLAAGTSHEGYENSVRKEGAEGEDTSIRSLTELDTTHVFAHIAFIDT